MRRGARPRAPAGGRSHKQTRQKYKLNDYSVDIMLYIQLLLISARCELGRSIYFGRRHYIIYCPIEALLCGPVQRILVSVNCGSRAPSLRVATPRSRKRSVKSRKIANTIIHFILPFHILFITLRYYHISHKIL